VPPGHKVHLDYDVGGWPIMVCTSAVQRNKYKITSLSYDTQTGLILETAELWE
jgi:hypothetical protein